MISSDASHAPQSGGWPRPGAIAGLLLLCTPIAGNALDTTVDFRDAQQSSRVGTDVFRSYTRRSAIIVRQTARLRQPWVLDGSFRVIRDTAGSDATGSSQESERWTYQPAVTLTYNEGPLVAGARGNWIRRDATGDTALSPRSLRSQYSGWVNADVTSSTRLTSNLSYTRSREEQPFEDDFEQTGLNGFLLAEQSLGREFTLDYRLTGVSTDLISRSVRRTQWTNDLDFVGTPKFAADRVNTYLRARTRWFSQRVEVGDGAEASFLLDPLAAAVILDSTPETLDPLEDQGVPEPRLFDGDLETPTSINIGDNASVVLEWGGDYRNIRYDFGETQSYESAILYVDTRLLLPQLFQWRIFVTDDPNAREWTEVPSDRAVVRYVEIGTDLQGWQVTLSSDVAGRHFKMVNVKIGQTLPDLFVTEMEVFVRGTSDTTADSRQARRHDLTGRVGWDVTTALRVGYEGRFQRRIFEQENRDIDRIGNAVFGRYDFNRTYGVNARAENTTLTNPVGRDTDISVFQVTATRAQSLRLSGSLAWNRTVDASDFRSLTTDALSLATNWRIYPRLTFRQTLSYGLTQDDVLALQSRSIVMVNRVEGTPVTSVFVGVRWAERWVSQDLGVGYDRFTDTQLDLTWSPAPLVSLSSRTRYQRRFESVWDSRQSLNWSPLRGGAVETVVVADIYYDSRVRVWEEGARLNLTWRVWPGLRAEGSIQIRRFDLGGVRTTPVTTFAHISWSF